MAFTWQLSEIRSRWRELTGLSSTSDIANATIDNWINDYYQNFFPDEAYVDNLDTFFTQNTSATDDGEYSLSSSDLRLKSPAFCDNEEIEIIQDSKLFFQMFPDNEQYLSEPTLVIGSTTTKVGYSAFSYKISGNGYEVDSGEITLSGDTVPQNKYGAFGFKIDSDGDITIIEATSNSTGYDSVGEAVADLEDYDGDSVYMGYITVYTTDSSGFVPGTTALNHASLTVTYTDGRPDLRSIPMALCVYGGKLYVRPKSNDIFRLKLLDETRPTAFTQDTSAPSDVKWGPAIASGSALMYITQVMKDSELAQTIIPIHDSYIKSIRGKKIKQMTEIKIQRSF